RGISSISLLRRVSRDLCAALTLADRSAEQAAWRRAIAFAVQRGKLRERCHSRAIVLATVNLIDVRKFSVFSRRSFAGAGVADRAARGVVGSFWEAGHRSVQGYLREQSPPRSTAGGAHAPADARRGRRPGAFPRRRENAAAHAAGRSH